MAQNYIVAQYERHQIKSKIPSSFGQRRSQYALSGSLFSQKLQEKTSSVRWKGQRTLWVPWLPWKSRLGCIHQKPIWLTYKERLLEHHLSFVPWQNKGNQNDASVCNYIQEFDNGCGTCNNSRRKKDWCEALQWISLIIPGIFVPYGIKSNKQSCNRPLRKPVQSGYHQFHRLIWELYVQGSVPQNSWSV